MVAGIIKSQETERSESVVQGHHNCISFGQVAAIVKGVFDTALEVGSTKDENLDREVGVLSRARWGPNVQIETKEVHIN